MIFNRKQLSKALTLLKRSAGSKGIPVLGCVYIERLSRVKAALTTSDLELVTRVELECKGTDQLGTTHILVHREFAAFVRAAKGEQIQLKATRKRVGTRLVVEASSGVRERGKRVFDADIVTTFEGINADEYPALPNELEYVDSANAGELREVIEQVLPAVTTDETRYNLAGINITNQDDGAQFVGSDGHRLALRPLAGVHFTSLGKGDATVPMGFWIQLLHATKGKPEAVVAIAFDQQAIAVRIDGTQLTCRLTGGEYPNYKQVIPKANGTKLVIDRVPWIEKLESLLPLLGGRNHGVSVSVAEDGTSAVLSGCGESSARSTLPLVLAGPCPKEPIGLDATYLITALKSFPKHAEHVSIDIDSEEGWLRPIAFTNAKTEGIVVVMPIRIA